MESTSIVGEDASDLSTKMYYSRKTTDVRSNNKAVFFVSPACELVLLFDFILHTDKERGVVILLAYCPQWYFSLKLDKEKETNVQ